MDEKEFALRLSMLRTNKGVSARDMSLSLGQNPSYINHIECGRALPSMSVFFYICEYLEISPQEFFEGDSKNPVKINGIVKDLKELDDEQLDMISALIKNIVK